MGLSVLHSTIKVLLPARVAAPVVGGCWVFGGVFIAWRLTAGTVAGWVASTERNARRKRMLQQKLQLIEVRKRKFGSGLPYLWAAMQTCLQRCRYLQSLALFPTFYTTYVYRDSPELHSLSLFVGSHPLDPGHPGDHGGRGRRRRHARWGGHRRPLAREPPWEHRQQRRTGGSPWKRGKLHSGEQRGRRWGRCPKLGRRTSQRDGFVATVCHAWAQEERMNTKNKGRMLALRERSGKPLKGFRWLPVKKFHVPAICFACNAACRQFFPLGGVQVH